MRKRSTFEIRDYWPWLVGIGDMEKIISSLEPYCSFLNSFASVFCLGRPCVIRIARKGVRCIVDDEKWSLVLIGTIVGGKDKKQLW
jgi:hypothetical protein